MGLVERGDGWRIPDVLWSQIEPLIPSGKPHPRPDQPIDLPAYLGRVRLEGGDLLLSLPRSPDGAGARRSATTRKTSSGVIAAWIQAITCSFTFTSGRRRVLVHTSGPRCRW